MTRSRRRKLQRQQAGLPTAQAQSVPRRVRVALPIASAILAAIQVAHAQDAAPTAPTADNSGLAEVVVTAQKRVENLQSVPVSVEVLDASKIQQLDIVNIDDYVKYSPSVAYVRGQGEGSNGEPGDDHIYIRGVVSGGDGNHSGSQPSVGVYFDEQPVTTIDGTPDVHIYDVQRIEVLEGPQGTLFGASSESGTVRIISNKPDPTKFDAGYDLDTDRVDHGGTGYQVEGFVNIPLASFAAIRLVGWDEHDAGYISNVAGSSAIGCISNGVRTFPTWAGQPAGTDYPIGAGAVAPCPTPGVIGAGAISNAGWTKSNYNTVDTRGGRLAMKFDIGDNWTVMPQFMGQALSTEGFFGYDPSVGDLEVVHYGPESTQDYWQQSALTVEGKFSNFDLVYAGAYMKRDTYSIAEYSDYSEFYDRVYGSGAYWVGNNGNPIMPEEFVDGKGYFEKWSHEVRLTTPDKYPVKGTVGLFMERQLHDIWQIYTMPGYGYVDVDGNVENPNGFADALSVPGYYNTIWLTDEQRVDRDKAAFAQVSWDITSQLTLTGGERYYWYDNSLEGFFGYGAGYSSGTGQAGCFTGPIVKGTPCTNLNTSVSDTGTVPRINLNYKITPEQMVYLTYSKGFRPGGVNRVAGAVPYKADYLTNYEFGWKTEWFNHHVRWNGAAFWEDWKNFQFSFLVPPSITAIANGGSARIKGVENEIQWVVGGGLNLGANFTFLDPRLTQNYCGISGVTSCPTQVTYDAFLSTPIVGPLAPAGTNLPIAPKFKGNLVARYTLNPIGEWEPYLQGSWVYQTQVAPLLRVDETEDLGMQPAYGLVDLQGGVNYGKFMLYLYVSNAFDRRAQLSRFTETNPVADNQVYILPTQPRTIGLHFAERF
ncbi:MAG TPA: TonB-dependent receptor [Steroidobacteraceae bacterium]|nr:TonB-dependent receptor [Steroidobacteraceae bacterium]